MRLRFRPTAPFLWALVVLVLLPAAVSGAFAPAAAAAPDAAQIDGFLGAHGSPMTGTGAVFVAEGQEHGVDPAFLVAIAGAETSFGRLLYAEGVDQCTFNAFNWFYAPTRPQSDFVSWDEAIGRVAQGLAGELYYGAGLYSVGAIAPRYCPDGTGNWIANVTAFMTELGGDPADARLADAGTLPPAPQPGLVALDGAVKLSRGAREVGKDVRARFSIVNRGGQTLTVDGVRLAVRGPAGAGADLVSDQAVTLAPGQAFAVVATWAPEAVGRWYGWIEVVQTGAPSLVGERQAFAFRAGWPRDFLGRRWAKADATLNAPE